MVPLVVVFLSFSMALDHWGVGLVLVLVPVLFALLVVVLSVIIIVVVVVVVVRHHLRFHLSLSSFSSVVVVIIVFVPCLRRYQVMVPCAGFVANPGVGRELGWVNMGIWSIPGSPQVSNTSLQSPMPKREPHIPFGWGGGWHCIAC